MKKVKLNNDYHIGLLADFVPNRRKSGSYFSIRCRGRGRTVGHEQSILVYGPKVLALKLGGLPRPVVRGKLAGIGIPEPSAAKWIGKGREITYDPETSSFTGECEEPAFAVLHQGRMVLIEEEGAVTDEVFQFAAQQIVIHNNRG